MSTTTSPSRAAQHAVTLPHTRRAPSVARRVSERWLGATAPEDRVKDAVAIVSELVTNTVRHTSDGCTLTLTVDGGRLDIAVADHSEEFPELSRHSGGDEHGGFGMQVIRELGGQVRSVPMIGGKTVHVLIELRTERDPCEGG
ncbi:ATP-binding protein [Streptomyces sp. NPDC000658]|uniref:ATP-binding protein n=1 Tax=Streptomyces sp. NPDC000658 TaxID=3154266 RepID=UPI00331A6249